MHSLVGAPWTCLQLLMDADGPRDRLLIGSDWRGAWLKVVGHGRSVITPIRRWWIHPGQAAVSLGSNLSYALCVQINAGTILFLSAGLCLFSFPQLSLCGLIHSMPHSPLCWPLQTEGVIHCPWLHCVYTILGLSFWINEPSSTIRQLFAWLILVQNGIGRKKWNNLPFIFENVNCGVA